jgi:hypothetical protein
VYSMRPDSVPTPLHCRRDVFISAHVAMLSLSAPAINAATASLLLFSAPHLSLSLSVG